MPAKRKTKPQVIRKLREGGYSFHVYPSWTEVYKGRRCLGAIAGMKELSGRHCFRLKFDSRRQPRTYRGRIQAAEALEAIDFLMREARKKHWSTEQLIIRSWDGKPRASSQATD